MIMSCCCDMVMGGVDGDGGAACVPGGRRRHSFPGNASSIFEQEEGIARKWRMRPHPYHRSDLLSLFRWLMQHNNRHTIIYYFGSSIHVRDRGSASLGVDFQLGSDANSEYAR